VITRFLGIGVILWWMTIEAQARDYGQRGAGFAIVEPDLLAHISARLNQAKSSGQLDALNRDFATRSEARVRRPAPVAGISPAVVMRVWNFDPSITIDHDVRDHKGALIVAAGTRVNPLDFTVIRQKLIFLDGDNKAQMAWALDRYTPQNAKLILVNGAPLEAMSRHKRRFFFDQTGFLTNKFGIAHTPAVVEQNGKVMRVTEHVLSRADGQ
jgi:conjugal transfer pilus assembly protein TraW